MSSSFAQDLKTTLSELGSCFTTGRSQVIGLAKKDLQKKTKRSALGWFWLFFQPAVYILCFWFALYLGIKAAKNGLSGGQYMLWLASGVIPWWFMRGSLNSGPTCINRYKYLVNRLKFPVALIPVFTQLSGFMFQIVLVLCLTVGYFASGGQLTIYFLQLPLIMLLMFVFFVGFSMLTAPLVAISADVGNLIKALVTPIFWLSGIIFDTSNLDNSVVLTALKLDPVAFFATGYRKVLSGVNPGWIWDDPSFLLLGLAVIVVTVVLGVLVFSRLRRDLADVL